MVHRPRKRFGQNFLQDQAIIQAILQALNAQKEDKVLEIGPGLGALTLPLLKSLQQLIVIELDRDLVQQLELWVKKYPNFVVVAKDALKVDYAQWGDNLRIIGNLPYNISTALLMHLLQAASHIKDMHFMLQKEVALRLAAKPKSKAYGRLSILSQYYCAVEYLFDVPATAFYPMPKVESAIVRLTPYTISPYQEVDVEMLKTLLAQAFSMRRKTLINNLKPMIHASQLAELNIPAQARPEEISIEEYINIVKCKFS